jgi:formate hydrogenlyase transcriptional activator
MAASSVIHKALNSPRPEPAQTELEREQHRLKLLLDMTNTLMLNLEPRDLLRAISVDIRQDMGCDAAGVWLPDSDHSVLRQLAQDFPESNGFSREDMTQPIECEAGNVLRTGKPFVVRTPADVTSQWGISAIREEAIKSACALPLISRHRTLGVLGLGSRVENSFGPEDVDFLMRAAAQVAMAIENALAYSEITRLKDKLEHEKLYLEEEIRSVAGFEGIVGESSALRQVLQLIETVAKSDSTVLLLGETGTGKELIARAVHDRSFRKERSFVKLNCAAIPTGLLESELFGHERGAFTGAVSQKTGRLELADQGTLFLDEVGDIPLELQPKLLRVLQDGEFERLGSTRTKKVDIRLVAATNRDLDKMIEDRQFRSDLYYRLNVFPVRIPPLRERLEDIPLLVRYFGQKYARHMQKQIESIPAATMRKLTRWHWPGNIRELQNLVERAVILTHSSTLAISVPELASVTATSRFQNVGSSDEHDRIARVLEETKGQVGGPKGAAARLGLKRTTLLSRMKKMGINPRKLA